MSWLTPFKMCKSSSKYRDTVDFLEDVFPGMTWEEYYSKLDRYAKAITKQQTYAEETKMGLQSKKQEFKTSELPFPKLMVNDLGDVVLFSRTQEGSIVFKAQRPNDSRKAGYHSDCWVMNYFSDYKGLIELTNEGPF